MFEDFFKLNVNYKIAFVLKSYMPGYSLKIIPKGGGKLWGRKTERNVFRAVC